jgi:hypothetical protein
MVATRTKETNTKPQTAIRALIMVRIELEK